MQSRHVNKGNFVLWITPVVLLAARHLMVLLHEWTHSITAWALGHKKAALAIHYGDWTLLDAHEAVDYAALFAAGRGKDASLIAASALLVNLVIFLCCFPLLTRPVLRDRGCIHMFVFWFTAMNIGQWFSYMPIRTFVGNRGDVGHFLTGLRISPWLVFIPGTAVAAWGLWMLFTRAMPRLNEAAGFESPRSRLIHMGLLVGVIFFWFGAAAFNDYGLRDPRSLASLAAAATGIGVFLTWKRSLERKRK